MEAQLFYGMVGVDSFISQMAIRIGNNSKNGNSTNVHHRGCGPLTNPGNNGNNSNNSIIFITSHGTADLLSCHFVPRHITNDNAVNLNSGGSNSGNRSLVLPIPYNAIIFRTHNRRNGTGRPNTRLTSLHRRNSHYIITRNNTNNLNGVTLTGGAHHTPNFTLLNRLNRRHSIVLRLGSVTSITLINFPSTKGSSLVTTVDSTGPGVTSCPFAALIPGLNIIVTNSSQCAVTSIPKLVPNTSRNGNLKLRFLHRVRHARVVTRIVSYTALRPSHSPVSSCRTLRGRLTLCTSGLRLPLNTVPVPRHPHVIVLGGVSIPRTGRLTRFIHPRFRGLKLGIFRVSATSRRNLGRLGFTLSTLIRRVHRRITGHRRTRRRTHIIVGPLRAGNHHPHHTSRNNDTLRFAIRHHRLNGNRIFFRIHNIGPRH